MTNILWLPLFFGFAFSGGLYYEYSYTTTGKDMDVRGVTRLYFEPAGKSRLEIDVLHGHAPRTIPQTVVLGDMSRPGECMSLFNDTRTYVVGRLPDTLSKDPIHTSSVVALLGREKVDGYDCVHARIVTSRMMGERQVTDTLDVWKSPDVPAIPSLETWMDRFASRTGDFSYTRGTAARLRQIGCDGVLVALELRTPTVQTRQDLVKVSHRDLSDAMFRVPAGYTQRHEDY